MPSPIIRKIADLHRRIVPNAYPNRPHRDWSNRVISGDIKNLFDGDTSTFVEIDNNNSGANGDGYSYITFDLGKPRILDRVVLTNYAGNVSFNVKSHQDFWIPTADIFSSSTFTNYNLVFDHASTTPITDHLLDINSGGGYVGTDVSEHKVRYIKIRLVDDGALLYPYFNTYSQNFKFAGLDIYEQFDARDFSVEFNDSVLDMQGWTGPRYSGCNHR